MDVYGFNITYEIVDIDAKLRTDACSVYKCSFLGTELVRCNAEHVVPCLVHYLRVYLGAYGLYSKTNNQ